MSLLRKLRRKAEQNDKINHCAKPGRFVLEELEPRLLLAADLGVSNLAIDAGTMVMDQEDMGMFHWGGQVDLTADVTNAGDAIATGGATVSFYLSDDNVLDTNVDVLLPESLTVTDLGIGATSQNSVSVTLPGTGTDGDKYLFMFADSANVIDELTNENNNTSSMWLPVGSGELASGVDLVAKGVGLPGAISEYQFGSSYPVTVGAFNGGSTSTGATFTLDVFLSSDALFDAGDTSILDGGALTVPTSLASGAIYEATAPGITLPAGTDGNFYILTVADSTNYHTTGGVGEISETFEGNNVMAQPITLANSPTFSVGGEDLVAAAINLEGGMFGDLIWGQTYNVESFVYNIGDTSAATDISIAMWLADVGTPATPVHSFTTTPNVITAPLASGGLSLDTISITMPAAGTVSDGPYVLVLKADSSDSYVNEGSEADNLVSIPITAATAAIDLFVVNYMDDSMEPMVWQGVYEMDVEIFNDGNSTAGSFDIDVVLSTNSTYDSGDSSILTSGAIAVASLGAYEDVENIASITLPTAPAGGDGEYFIIIVADSGEAVSETGEANNIFVMPIDVLTSSSVSGIDLVVSDFEYDDGSDDLDGNVSFLSWNTTYTQTLDFNTYNMGDTTSGTYDFTVRLSTDPYYDAGDIQVGNVTGLATVGPLNVYYPATALDMVVPVQGGNADGGYFLVAQAGPAVGETIVGNNTSFAVGVHVGGLVSGVDLLGQEFEIDNADAFELYWGQQGVMLAADVRNAGDTPAGEFDVNFYLSADATTEAGELVGTYTYGPLGAGNVEMADLVLNMPSLGGVWTADGNYNLIMAINDGVTPVNEGGNTGNNSWSIPVAVAGAQPDVTFSDTELLTTNSEFDMLWGDSFELELDVENLGNADANNTEIKIVLSTDNVFDGADEVLATLTRSIFADSELFNDVDIVFPSTAPSGFSDGVNYIIAMVDSNSLLDESDETNNSIVQAITINTTATWDASTPDLVLVEFGLDLADDMSTLGWGEHIPVAIDIYNDGDTAAGAFTVSVAISSTSTYDPTNVVGTYNVTGLAAGAIEYVDMYIDLPELPTLTDGVYHINVLVDSAGAITEADTSNNTGNIPDLYVGQNFGTDLTVNPFDLDEETPLFWGGTFDLPIQARNSGQNDVTDAFTVKVFLDPDIYTNGGEIELQNVNIASLVSGVVSPATPVTATTINLPGAGVDGNYWIVTQVDWENAIDETDIFNNSYFVPVFVGLPFDLEMSSTFFMPAVDILWDGEYEIPVDITNIGADDVTNGFDLTVVISSDNIFDANDDILSNLTIPNLAAAAESLNDVTVTMPTVGSQNTAGTHTYADGTYYIIGKVDSFDAISEADETNNIFVETIAISTTPVLSSGIDVQVIDFGLEIPPTQPLSIGWGSHLPVFVELYNDGDTAAGAVTLTVSISTDNVIDVGDTTVGTSTVTSMTPGEFSQYDFFIDLPESPALTDGTYYLLVSASAAGDTNSANDTATLAGVAVAAITGVNLMPNQLSFTSTAGTIYWGESIDVYAQVRNAGDTVTTGTSTATIMLDADGIINGNETILNTLSVPVLTGGTISPANPLSAVSTTLPTTGTDGVNYLILSISPTGIDDVDIVNNTMIMPIAIGTGQPDLVVSDLSLPVGMTFEVGGSHTGLTTTITNSGTALSGSFNSQVLLSTDAIFDSTDMVLTTLNFTTIAPGQTSQQAITFDLPLDVVAGNYYLAVVADAGGTVTESNENNNASSTLITINFQRPDLEANNLILPPEIFVAGGLINIDTMINNLGDTDVTQFEFKIILSADADLTSNNLAESSFTSSVLAYGFSQQMVPFTFPSNMAAGSYYIGLIIDPADGVDELREDNNTISVPIQVELALPDLAISPNFWVPPGPYSAGDMLDISNEIQNMSMFDAGSFTVTFVLSSDANINTSDMVIGQRTVGGINGYGLNYEHNFLAIPNDGTVAAGNYYLGVIADSGGVVAELDEQNNTALVPISIVPPQIDFIVAFFSPYTYGPFFWGDEFGATADVRNDGQNEAPATQATIYLSSDDIVDAGDLVLNTIPVSQLPAGGLAPNDINIILPDETVGLLDGEYNLIMVSDSANNADEINETNNSWIVPIYIETPAPSPIDLEAPQGPVGEIFEMMWGQSYEVPAIAFNASDAPVGPFDITVVLSQDDIYDSGDQVISIISVPGLEPWMDSMNDVMLELPQIGDYDGIHYIISYVDSGQAIDEVNEDNNVSVQEVDIITPVIVAGIDLQIMEFDFDMFGGNFGWGQSYVMAADVFNSGDSDAGAFVINVALSSDGVFDNIGETILATINLPSLAAGAMSSNDVAVTLPVEGILPNGPYHLIMSVDSENAVEEFKEDNNIASFIVNVGQDGADLALFNMFMPFDAAWGDVINIEAMVENMGSQTVGPVTVSFYSSDDWSFDPAVDTLLDSTTIATLAGGSSAVVSGQFTLAADGQGEQLMHIIGVVDPDNTIVEFDEQFNNMMISDLYVSGAELPNLMAWPMIMFGAGQDNVDWGDSITVDAMVDNFGNVGVEAFAVSYYLSSDEIVGSDDVTLGRSNIAAMAPFGHIYLEGVSLQMPASSPNENITDWYILAKADSGDVINEYDENDNTGWNPIYIGSMPADLSGWMDFNYGTELFWGDDVTLNVQIDNFGGSDAGQFDITYYLSNDPEIDASDVQLAPSQIISSVAAGSNTGFLQHTITLPDEPLDASSNMIFILAHIDSGDVVNEVDEWNNYMGAWLSPDVAAADLVAFYADGGFNAMWSDEFTQNEMVVNYEFGNFGNQDAGNFEVSFYLADSMNPDDQNHLLGSETIVNIAADTDYVGQITVALPKPGDVAFAQGGNEDNTYMLMMRVDSVGFETGGQISEIFEDNNTFMMPLRLEALHGMIEVTDTMNAAYDWMIDFGPVLSGEQVSAGIVVSNLGMGYLNISDIVSDNPDISIESITGLVLPNSLAPQGTLEFTVTFSSDIEGFNQGNISIINDDPWQNVIDINVWADVAGAPIDLAVDGVDAPLEAFWGETITVTVSGGNYQTGDMENDVHLGIMLSDTPDNMGMMMPLFDVSLPGIVGGGTINEQIEIMLPEVSPFGYGGDLFVVASLYPTGNDFEENFFNNENFAPINITSEAIGKPDLMFNWLGVPPEAGLGQEIHIDLGVRNIGMADAGAFEVSYYLSSNDVLDSRDNLLDVVSIPGLSADMEMTESFMVTLPADDISDGMYYLIVQIDSGDAVEEEFEGNNLALARFNVSIGPGIDLIAQAITAPAQITLGQEFVVNLDVANVGTEIAQDVRVEFFMSDSTGTGGFYMGSMMLGSLTPTEIPGVAANNFVFTTILPNGIVQAGQDYYIEAFIDADNSYEESNEDNNFVVSSSVAVSGAQIDLAIDIANAPAAANWGESLPLDVTVSNTGTTEAGPFFMDIMLSSDQTWDETDFYLASVPVYGLPIDPIANSITVGVDIFLPNFVSTGDGDYYFVINIVGENTEFNVAYPADTAIAISGTPDLSIYIENMPFNANFGQTIIVTDVVENFGNSDANDEFDVIYYLSQDSMFDPQLDIQLGSRTIASLASGAQNTVSTELVLNQPENWPEEGMFNIIAVVDPANQIKESYEDYTPAGQIQFNNVAPMPLEIISQGMPDLQATSLSSSEATADWDGPIWIQYALENIGTADTDGFNVTFYLSDNASVTTRDYVLDQISITSLEAGGVIDDFTELTLPADNPFGADGEFYIGMLVDSDAVVPEINENNNIVIANEAVTIGTVITVDLLAAYVDSPSVVQPYMPMSIYNEVYNSGSTPAGSFDVDLYLTTNGSIDETSILLGSRTVASLGAGSFDGEVTDFTLSEQTLSAYYNQSFMVVMQVNPQAIADPEGALVAEQTYENNTTVAPHAMYVIEPIQTDIEMLSISSDAQASWGDSVNVQFELDSQIESDDPIAVSFYLSQSGSAANALLLGQTTVTPSAGQAIAGQFEITLPVASPFGRDGSFQLLAIADPDNLIEESDEANNTAQTAITVGSNKADLVALSISTTPQTAAGETISVYNDIENVGSEDAGSFDVYFYLAANNNTVDTASDTLLGMRQVSALPFGDFNWAMSSLTIGANVADGNYYLAMVVDKFDDVDEASESNNVVFSDTSLRIHTVTIDPDDYEPNNSNAMASSITIDSAGLSQTISASLHDNNDRDYYTFTTPSNTSGFVRIDLQGDENLNAAILVYDYNDALTGGADNDPAYGGGEVYNTFDFAPGRSYTILVKPMGDSFGEYTMDIELGLGAAGDVYEENNTLATASYLGSSDIILDGANIHSGDDVDYYQFTIPATSTGMVDIFVGSDPTLDAVVQVYDADENLVASADAEGAGSVEMIALEGNIGDSYYVRVSAWAQSTGAYYFDVIFNQAQLPDVYEPNDSSGAAYDMGSDALSLTDPGIHLSTDVDYYALTVPAGASSLQVTLYGSATLDGVLAIHDADGAVLRYVDRSGTDDNETLLLDGLVRNQELFLAVSSQNDTTGRYGLELQYHNEDTGDFAEPNDQVASAYHIIAENDSVVLFDLSLHNADDQDYFSFVAPANTDGTATISVRPDGAAGTLNVSLRLLDSSEVALASTDATGAGENENLSLASGLVAGETYYIDVNGWGTTGSYELYLETPTTGGQQTQPVGPLPTYSYNNAWGMNNYGYMPSGQSAQITVVEEIGNPNDDDLSFGTVSLGNSLSGQVVILNTGGTDLNITDIVSDNSVFTVTPGQATISSGQSQVLTVTFTPAALQLYSDANLTISYGGSSDYTLALGGTGSVSSAKPDIEVLDSQSNTFESLAFSDTIIDGDSTVTFLITNTGASMLSVSSAIISGADSDVFEIVQTNIANKSSDDYSIAAGGQRAIQVIFQPNSSGTHDAVLTLTSSDPDESVVQIPLTGGAVAPELVIDLSPSDGIIANALDPSVAFGQQVADGTGGQYAQYAINIVNTGSTPLTISSIVFGLESSPYSIIGDGVDLNGFTVAANASIPAWLIFDPDVLNLDDNAQAAQGQGFYDTMTVYSDDLDTPIMRFTLSGQAIEAYVETSDPDGLYSFTYTDPDGDVALVKFGRSGTAEFSFDGAGLDNANLISIVITGASGSSSLIITDTNSAGNGIINIGSITIDSDFGKISIDGDITSLDVDGAIKKITLDGTLAGLDADGYVSSLTVGELTGSISASAFGTITVNGDIDTAVITADDSVSPVIKTIKANGAVDNSSISGALGKLTVADDISDTTIDATGFAIKGISLKGDADNLSVTADSLTSIDVKGDMIDSSFSILNGSLDKVKVTGDADNLSLAVDGDIKSITTGGSLGGQINAQAIGSIKAGSDITVSITAQGPIKSIKAGGDIISSALRIEDGNSDASLKSLTAAGNINITDFTVDGDIGSIKAGARNSSGDLSGSINTDGTIKTIKILGDIYADITANTALGTIQASGSLKGGADITSTTGDIARLLIDTTIYGTVTANNGDGQIKKITYDDSTFRDPDTEMIDLPWQHLIAQW